MGAKIKSRQVMSLDIKDVDYNISLDHLEPDIELRQLRGDYTVRRAQRDTLEHGHDKVLV